MLVGNISVGGSFEHVLGRLRDGGVHIGIGRVDIGRSFGQVNVDRSRRRAGLRMDELCLEPEAFSCATLLVDAHEDGDFALLIEGHLVVGAVDHALRDFADGL